MEYRYEMHQHTAPCSHCGRADPAELITEMKAQGFSGCVITDHFYHGNSGIDRALPWKDFCAPYEKNFLLAKEAGDRLDFDVLFGLEEGVGEGKEVLLYGIDCDFMYAHPELRHAGLREIYELAHAAGAVVIQAHPFRSRDYIDNPDKPIDRKYLDGYEIFNSCNIEEDNEKAKIFLSDETAILTAGSDSHHALFENRSCIICSHRIRTGKELADTLRSGDYCLSCSDGTIL